MNTSSVENVIALGNSGTGKTHIALGLGLAACQKGLTVLYHGGGFGPRDEKRLLRFQKQLAKYKLLIIDEPASCRLAKPGPSCCSRCSANVTKAAPPWWPPVYRSMNRGVRFERVTGALLDRLTHHVHILEMNGDSYRLNQSQKRRKPPKT